MYVLNAEEGSRLQFKNKKILFSAWFANSENFATPKYYGLGLETEGHSFLMAWFFCKQSTDWQFFDSDLKLHDSRLEKLIDGKHVFTKWTELDDRIFTVKFFKDFQMTIAATGIKARILVDSDDNPDVVPNFKEISLDTSNKTLAYEKSSIGCPVDPATNSQMSFCLNWRRVDDIGKEFVSILTPEEMRISAKSFCLGNQIAEDCKCINRSSYAKYLSEKNDFDETIPDYCWYKPCKSGSYLLDENKTTCNGALCSLQYNSKDIYGKLIFPENKSKINCNSFDLLNKKFKTKIATPPPPSKKFFNPSDPMPLNLLPTEPTLTTPPTQDKKYNTALLFFFFLAVFLALTFCRR